MLTNDRWIALLFLAIGALVLTGCPADDDDDATDDDAGLDSDITHDADANGGEDVDDGQSDDAEEDATDDADEEVGGELEELPPGQVRFNHNDAFVGTFDVDGSAIFDNGIAEFGEFAYGRFHSEDDEVVVFALQPEDDSQGDAFAAIIPSYDGETGELSFEDDCLEQDDPDCIYAVYLRNVEVADLVDVDAWLDAPEETFIFDSGTINIFNFRPTPNSVGIGAIYGQFHGQAPLYDPDDEHGRRTLNVASGSLDVPLVLE